MGPSNVRRQDIANMDLFLFLINFPDVERRRGAAGIEESAAMCLFDCESLRPCPALVNSMVKRRLVIRALERPAECRERRGGGREDGSCR